MELDGMVDVAPATGHDKPEAQRHGSGGARGGICKTSLRRRSTYYPLELDRQVQITTLYFGLVQNTPQVFCCLYSLGDRFDFNRRTKRLDLGFPCVSRSVRR